MVLFGSGGHTTEILLILKKFDFTQYKKVYFVKANSDNVSKGQVMDFIDANNVKINKNKQIQWVDIPRSRNVKQSYFTSIFTTLYSFIVLFLKQLKIKDISLIVCNGPGSNVPIVINQKIIDILLYFYNNRQMSKIIFFESWCRVEYLSLTGKILIHFVDNFIVHWEQLANKNKKCEYRGQII